MSAERNEGFGEQLRRHRDLAGLTQEELAERAGLTAKAIGALERGDRQRPYPQPVRALAEALDLADEPRRAFVAAARTGTSGSADEAPLAIGRIPTVATPLFGRADDLNVIGGQLRASEVRLLTLIGPGGVGKTRLAIAAANELAGVDRFAHGIVFVDLSLAREDAHVPQLIA